VSELPKPIEQAVREEEWRDAAIERATAPPSGGEPEPEDRVQAFVRRTAEEYEAEARHEARVSRAMHENPAPDVDDPLRAFAREQQARRRQVKRRLPR
jgi:hypothetical protein